MLKGTSVLLIGLMICLNMAGFAFASANATEQSLNPLNADLVINGDQTYGENGSVSQFFLDGNLTISASGNMTFFDTVINVEGNMLHLTVYGSLTLYDSKIIPTAAGDNISLMTEGVGTGPAHMGLYNSYISIPGTILIVNSSASFYQSNLSSGLNTVNSPENALTISIVNSSLDAYGSSFSGLVKTNDSSLTQAGTGLFHPAVPASSNTSFNYAFSNYVNSDVKITSVLVNVTYSGNNPTGENSLVFGYDNGTYAFKIPSTGDIMVENSAEFILGMNETFQNLTLFESDFSTIMQMNGQIGSNSSIERISLSLQTNDSVDLFGDQFFSYEMKNSNVTLINSVIGVNTDLYDQYRNLPNPDHNWLMCSDSVIYMANSSINNSGDSPFYELDNSTLNFFSEVTVRAHSGSYPDSGFVPGFIARMNGNYTNGMNSAIDYSVSQFIGTNGFYIANDSAFLLTGFVNNTGSVYTGLYNVSIFGEQYPLSLMPYSLSSSNAVLVNYSTDLPIVIAGIESHSLIEGTTNLVNFTLTDLSGENLSFNCSCILRVGGSQESEQSGTFFVDANGSVTLSFNESLSFYAASNATISLDLQSQIPIWTGTYYNTSFNISLLASAELNMTANYRWISDQSELGIDLYFNCSKAPFPAELRVNASLNLSGDVVFRNETYQLGSEKNVTQEFEIALFVSQVPDHVDVRYDLIASDPSYNTTWSDIPLPIEGNSSYFAYSLITFSENGLPEGSLWSVVVDGSVYSSYTGFIEDNISHGTHDYTVLGIAGYAVVNGSGEFSTNSSSIIITLQFNPYTYDLKIDEQGLASGSDWYVLIAGKNFTSHNASMDIPLANGTYLVTAGSVGYLAGNSTNVLITGSGLNCTIVFTAIESHPVMIQLLETILHSPLLYFGIIILILVYIAWYKPSEKTPSNDFLRKKRVERKEQDDK